jgi:hydrogenase maturation factor
MKSFQNFGKVNRKFLEEVVLSNLGANRKEVIRKPHFGVDTGSVRINNDKIMILSSDPLSIIPSIKLNESGWLSAHSLVNDVVTSGIQPAYASLVFNLPITIKDDEFRIYWNALTHQLEQLGVSVVCGHTGRYPGCDYSIVGAGTIIAIGDKDRIIDSSMAKDGDSIIITKGVALEATAILSKSFPNTVAEKIGEKALIKSQKTFYQCSTVNDALAASSVGVGENGITAMHDATEGGLFGGLFEIAAASSNGLLIEKELIPVSSEVKKICSFFGLDPYTTLSGGTLIITVNPNKERKVTEILKKKGINSAIVGKITESRKGTNYLAQGTKNPIIIPEEDPYWRIFWNATKDGWD